MIDKIIVAVIVFVAVVLTARRIVRRLRGAGSLCCDCKNCGCCCGGCNLPAEEPNAPETADDHFPK